MEQHRDASWDILQRERILNKVYKNKKANQRGGREPKNGKEAFI